MNYPDCSRSRGSFISHTPDDLALTIFEALVEQQEACLIPEQALDAVFATTAEQEKRRLVRVQMEPRDNQGGKPVDGLPHVCMAASQIDMFRREFSD